MTKRLTLGQLCAAFPVELVPPSDALVTGTSRTEEIESVLETYAGQPWTTLGPDAVLHDQDNIYFMTGEACAYYLPAFIIAFQERPEMDHFGTSLIALLVGSVEKQSSWYMRRHLVEHLNGKQRALVVEFLQNYIEDLSERDPEHREITDALAKWRALSAGK